MATRGEKIHVDGDLFYPILKEESATARGAGV
jgi:hypothetical protein